MCFKLVPAFGHVQYGDCFLLRDGDSVGPERFTMRPTRGFDGRSRCVSVAQFAEELTRGGCTVRTARWMQMQPEHENTGPTSDILPMLKATRGR